MADDAGSDDGGGPRRYQKKSKGPHQHGGQGPRNFDNDERVQKSKRFLPMAALCAGLGIPGPWVNLPMVGDVWMQMREKQNPGTTRDLKIYMPIKSPVCLLSERIRPDRDSQCGSFEDLVAQDRKILWQSLGKGPDDPSLLASQPSVPISKLFANGHIAFLNKRTAAGIASMPNVLEQLAPSGAASASVPAPVDGKAPEVQMQGESPPYYYWMVLPIPRRMYNNNPRHLLDFRNDKEAQQYGVTVSFVLKAMSNLGAAARKEENDLPITDMYFNGRIVKRVRVFLETVMLSGAGGLESYLAPDPVEVSQTNIPLPSPAIRAVLNRWQNFAGFLVHWVVYDQHIHPAVMFKAQIYWNRFEKNIVDADDLDMALIHSVQNTGFQKFVKEAQAKRKTADELEKQSKKEADDLDELEAGRRGEGPDKKKPKRGPPKKRANDDDSTSTSEDSDGEEPHQEQAEEDDDEDEDEDESNDSDGNSSEASLERGEMAEVGDPLDPEEEAREAKKLERELKKKGKNQFGNAGANLKAANDSIEAVIKQGQSIEAAVKTVINKAMEGGDGDIAKAKFLGAKGNQSLRSHLAKESEEPDARSSYRLVQDMMLLSVNVIHPVHTMAQTYDMERYPNGLHESAQHGGTTALNSMEYDLYKDGPMHYLRTFRIDIALSALMHSAAKESNKAELVSLLTTLQGAHTSYTRGPQRFISLPYPCLVAEYDPTIMDPGLLAQYQFPLGSSQVEAECHALELRARDHVKRLSHMKHAGMDVKPFQNSNLVKAQPLVLQTKQDNHWRAQLDAILLEAEKDIQTAEMAAFLQPTKNVAKEATTAPSISRDAIRRGQGILSHSQAESRTMGQPRTSLYSNASGTDVLTGGIKVRAAPIQRQGENGLAITNDEAQNVQQEFVGARKLNFMQRINSSAAKLAGSRQASAGAKNSIATLEQLRVSAANQLGNVNEFWTSVQAIMEDQDDDVRALLKEISRNKVELDSGTAHELQDSLEALNLSKLVKSSDDPEKRLRAICIEGPLSELRKKYLSLKIRILEATSALPFKTETDVLYNWLLNCHWSPSLAAEKNRELLEQEVLAAMTPEREQLYRQDTLSHMINQFRQEAIGCTLTIMESSNNDLGDVHLGIALYGERRGSSNFFTPTFTHDDTLEPFSMGMAMDLLFGNAACNMGDESGLHLLYLRTAFRMMALRDDKRLPQGMLILGTPASGKSHMLDMLERMSIKSTTSKSDHQSNLANAVAKPQEGETQLQHEAAGWLVRAPEKMSGAEKSHREREQGIFTNQDVNFKRNVANPTTGKRDLEHVHVAYRHTILALTNHIDLTHQFSVQDRTRKAVYVNRPSTESKGITDRMLASRFGVEKNEAFSEQFFKQCQDEQYIKAKIIILQNTLALPQVNNELHAVFLMETMRVLRRWLPYREISAREMFRSFNDVDMFTIQKAYHLAFRSELSNFIVWDRDPKTGRVLGRNMDDVRPFTEDQLMSLLGAHLYADAPVCLFSTTLFLREVYPLVEYEIMLTLASEMFNFSRRFFMPAYKRHNVPLQDLDALAAERGFPEGAYVHCGFLKDFASFERKLDQRVAERTLQRGHTKPFPSFRPVGRGARTTVDGKAAPAAACEYDPTYLYCKQSFSDFVNIAVHKVNCFFPGVDKSVMEYVISKLLRYNVQMTQWQHNASPTSQNLIPQGIEKAGNNFEGSAATKRGTAMQINNTTNEILLSTEFFMRPWHEVYYECLTASENAHSRSFDCVLPLVVNRCPDVMHRWQARSNAHHEVSLNSLVSSVPHRTIQSLYGLPLYDKLRPLVATHGMPDRDVMAVQSNMNNVSADMNLEQFVFRRHLGSIYYQPVPYGELKQAASVQDWSLESDPEKRLEIFAQSHPAAPGAASTAITTMHNTYPHFSDDKSWRLSYPDNIIQISKEANRNLKMAQFVEQELRKRRWPVSRKISLCPEQGAELVHMMDLLIDKPNRHAVNQRCAQYILHALDANRFPDCPRDIPLSLRESWVRAIKGGLGDKEKRDQYNFSTDILHVLCTVPLGTDGSYPDLTARTEKAIPMALVKRLQFYTRPLTLQEERKMAVDARLALPHRRAAEAYRRMVLDPKLGPYPNGTEWALQQAQFDKLKKVNSAWALSFAELYWQHKYMVAKQDRRTKKALTSDGYLNLIQSEFYRPLEVAAVVAPAVATPLRPPPPVETQKDADAALRAMEGEFYNANVKAVLLEDVVPVNKFPDSRIFSPHNNAVLEPRVPLPLVPLPVEEEDNEEFAPALRPPPPPPRSPEEEADELDL
jgi:hypothetical protein